MVSRHPAVLLKQINTRLCLSISDFHPDTWNPAWTVASILTGLISFMVENTPTLGSIETTTQARRLLAQQSLQFNLNNPIFCSLFPETACYIGDQLTLKNGANSQKSADKSPSKNDCSDCDNKMETAGEDETNNNNDNAGNATVADDYPAGERAIPAGENKHWALNGQLVNVCVVLGAAAFAFTVKCVLASTR